MPASVIEQAEGPGASGATGWANSIPPLAKHFKVYAIDLIGNGDTDIPHMEYSLQTLVEHVAGFVDCLKLSNIRIMGNSQGAYVAAKYALDHPGRVKSGALISTGNLASACGIERKIRGVDLPRFDGTKESLQKFLNMIVNDRRRSAKSSLRRDSRSLSGRGTKKCSNRFNASASYRWKIRRSTRCGLCATACRSSRLPTASSGASRIDRLPLILWAWVSGNWCLTSPSTS